MVAVSTCVRYSPYWARIGGACHVACTLLYAGMSSGRRPGTCILGRGTDRIYPLGRLPTPTKMSQKNNDTNIEDSVRYKAEYVGKLFQLANFCKKLQAKTVGEKYSFNVNI